ncbi:MAG: hypothetical protein ABWZ25_08750 [Chitinophagaceae bacterium]
MNVLRMWRYRLLRLCCALLWISAVSNAYSQEPKAILAEVMQQYTDSTFLSFDLKFTVSYLESRDQVFDSLHGSFALAGSKYAYQLDGTSAVSDGTTAMILFNEDKLMYLSKPATPGLSVGPVTLIDSAMWKNGFQHWELGQTDDGSEYILKCSLPDGARCRKVTLIIDKKKRLIRHAQYEMLSEQLVGEATPMILFTAGQRYSLVNVRFSNYSRTLINTSLFDLGRYFRKSATGYAVTEEFDNFQLFLGSTNL